ncbi:MBL fold metallo-hydrolase [Bacillus massiliigorillae]|uniref:MBL fold metallo-hydrolase n=1 Tax=Bacillus massiliigorillae TaxID=1243664 RepID=UPI0003A165C7|nr:MBL fold metallo-hydrolase [Bacillus massiliigorillae]
MARIRYQNYDQVSATSSYSDLKKWRKERSGKKKDLTVQIPHAERKDVEKLQTNRSDFSITWIGHSTFLIQMNGLNILTDPVWAKWMGVQKRLTKPGLSLEELPEIDMVFISHGHYDHLDFGTLKKLRGDITFYVPIGLKGAFHRRGYKKVVEANWWEQFQYEELQITFVPAQHWTRRTLIDTNTSHWGGWVFESNDTTIYFVGDTGYFRGFKEIGSKFSITYTLMPIGAYEPEWFMKAAHINPEDAITAFLETKGSIMIPMHYGAYRLADDTGPEALERLMKQWENLKLLPEQLCVLKHGETLWK